MNPYELTNHPEKYPHMATNKKTGEKVAYMVSNKRNGRKIYKVIVPSAGGIVTYDQPDFEHYFKRAG